MDILKTNPLINDSQEKRGYFETKIMSLHGAPLYKCRKKKYLRIKSNNMCSPRVGAVYRSKSEFD